MCRPAQLRRPAGRCLQAWLKRPLIDLEAIGQRLDVVEALHSDAQTRGDLRSLHLRGEPWPPSSAMTAWINRAQRPHKRMRKRVQARGSTLSLWQVLKSVSCLRAQRRHRSLRLCPWLPAGLPDLDKLCGKLERQRISLQVRSRAALLRCRGLLHSVGCSSALTRSSVQQPRCLLCRRGLLCGMLSPHGMHLACAGVASPQPGHHSAMNPSTAVAANPGARPGSRGRSLQPITGPPFPAQIPAGTVPAVPGVCQAAPGGRRHSRARGPTCSAACSQVGGRGLREA